MGRRKFKPDGYLSKAEVVEFCRARSVHKGLSRDILQRWSTQRRGPQVRRVNGLLLYRLDELELWHNSGGKDGINDPAIARKQASIDITTAINPYNIPSRTARSGVEHAEAYGIMSETMHALAKVALSEAIRFLNLAHAGGDAVVRRQAAAGLRAVEHTK